MSATWASGQLEAWCLVNSVTATLCNILISSWLHCAFPLSPLSSSSLPFSVSVRGRLCRWLMFFWRVHFTLWLWTLIAVTWFTCRGSSLWMLYVRDQVGVGILWTEWFRMELIWSFSWFLVHQVLISFFPESIVIPCDLVVLALSQDASSQSRTFCSNHHLANVWSHRLTVAP